MTHIQGAVAKLLADLDAAVTEVIAKNWGENGDVLQHHGPFLVSIRGVDGVIANFKEDGIELYPKEED